MATVKRSVTRRPTQAATMADIDPVFGLDTLNQLAAKSPVAPTHAPSLGRSGSGGSPSAQLFAQMEPQERALGDERTRLASGMTLQQGLALAPRTTTTGVSAGGVQFPTEGVNVPGSTGKGPGGEDSLFKTSSLIPIFQTNWMKNIPKNVWGADGSFSLPSAAQMLEQLKQPEWTMQEDVTLPLSPQPFEWATFKGPRLSGDIPGKSTAGLSEIFLPVSGDTPLTEVPAGFALDPGGKRMTGIKGQAFTGRGVDSGQGFQFPRPAGGTQLGDLGNKFRDILQPFYDDPGKLTVIPGQQPIVLKKWIPPSPGQSSPSGFFGLSPTQNIPI